MVHVSDYVYWGNLSVIDYCMNELFKDRTLLEALWYQSLIN